MFKPIIPHVHNQGLLWTIPGLQITLGRPLQFLPGCPPGLLVGASCPSRINQ